MILEGLTANILLALASLLVLMTCAQIAVRRMHRILDHYGYSDTFGGLVVFSVSTSIPEISSHLAASLGILSGKLNYEVASATVLGANIGSDVIQQTFVLGLVVLLMGGLKFEKDFLKTAYLPMIGTTLMCIILGWDGVYSRIDGLILFGTFIAYMAFLYKREERHTIRRYGRVDRSEHIRKDIALSLACIALIFVSANFLLSAVQEITTLTGLGGSLIGVVSLGVASASPELFTALFGIRERATGISLGTLIGSNITNPLVAIGGGALISTYWVPKPLVYWDLPMETITAALLLAYLIKTKGVLGKIGGVYLIGLYFTYLLVRIIYFPLD